MTARRRRGARTWRTLGSASSGATMVMGIFIAMLLVGMVYYVWGIGEAVAYREQMQDASDTSAYSAAVLSARGMNVIALLNIVMAAASFVATTFAAIVNGLGAATGLASLVCAATYGSEGCDEAETHGEETGDMSDTADDVSDDMEDIVETAENASTVVQQGIPALAMSHVRERGDEHPEPVESITLVPYELPVEDDDSDWPCEEKVAPHAQEMAPLGMLICCEVDYYLLFGMAVAAGTAESEAEEWCGEGYFKRVDEGAEMGDDDFQVRTVAEGDPKLDEWSEGVGLATWGEDAEAESRYESLRELTQYSVAQAEFYFDDEMDEEEWLWHMYWRARLRRFRLPSGGLGGLDIGGPGLSGLEGQLGDSIVH